LAKFAFEISAEFRALVAKLAFRENFAPEVLDENMRLVSAVRFQFGRAGAATSARLRLRSMRRQGLLMPKADIVIEAPPSLSSAFTKEPTGIEARASGQRSIKAALSREYRLNGRKETLPVVDRPGTQPLDFNFS
jgi:hypothetical protein